MAYHHGDVRQALVQAALSSLATTPPEALSLRALSESVGVSHTAAYRHFPDKQALLNAVSEWGFGEFHGRLRAAGELEAMVQAYVGFAIAQPNLYRLMFGPGFLERMSDESACAAAREAFSVLLTAVQAGQAAGTLVAGSAFLMSQTIWALLHGIALFALDGELAPESAAHVAREGWRLLRGGVGTTR